MQATRTASTHKQTAHTHTMRAMVLEKAGGPLSLKQVSVPMPGPGQVGARRWLPRIISLASIQPTQACSHGHGTRLLTFPHVHTLAHSLTYTRLLTCPSHVHTCTHVCSQVAMQEPSWVSYEDEAAAIKFALADSILEDMLAEAIEHGCAIAAKRRARREALASK